jgi:glycosyltransferase involved in cell wall biosynthesis
MIVKDEEKNLGACLESVRGIFDEIIVVDTGSKDRTIEIARSFGALVFEFAWVDDFAAARNEALAHATGDYVFWLDADDVVEGSSSAAWQAQRRPTRSCASCSP